MRLQLSNKCAPYTMPWQIQTFTPRIPTFREAPRSGEITSARNVCNGIRPSPGDFAAGPSAPLHGGNPESSIPSLPYA